MKIIISENQKNLLIKKFLKEEGIIDTKNDTDSVIGNLILKSIEKAKLNPSDSGSDDTSTSSSTDDSIDTGSTDNVKGSGSFGKVTLKGNFDTVQKNNISLLIDEMKKKGITDPLTQIGILSVIKKESNFKPKGEVSYSGTDNSRIRKIFGSRVRNFTDEQLNKLKSNARDFFNVVYAKTVGNQGGNDGWTFRGRGFNQLTGRKNYRKYGQIAGIDLEGNPEILNRNDVAVKVALAFLTKGKTTFPKFNSKEDAAKYFADINSGGGVSSHRGKAVEASKSFDVA